MPKSLSIFVAQSGRDLLSLTLSVYISYISVFYSYNKIFFLFMLRVRSLLFCFCYCCCFGRLQIKSARAHTHTNISKYNGIYNDNSNIFFILSLYFLFCSDENFTKIFLFFSLLLLLLLLFFCYCYLCYLSIFLSIYDSQKSCVLTY